MTITAKTKILRVYGAEIYFLRVEFHEPVHEVRWIEMRKEIPVLFPKLAAVTFKRSPYLTEQPEVSPMYKLVAPVPADFAQDLLRRYVRNEYARGHEPDRTPKNHPYV